MTALAGGLTRGAGARSSTSGEELDGYMDPKVAAAVQATEEPQGGYVKPNPRRLREECRATCTGLDDAT